MSEKEMRALQIVNRHTLYCGAVGLIPAPLVNIAGIAALEGKMLYDLSKHYEIPYKADRVKSIVSALLGGITSTELAYSSVGGALKALPVLGSILGVLTLPLFASAITYAIGKVFIQHFESGGTFLDFEPEKVRTYFHEQFVHAKQAVA